MRSDRRWYWVGATMVAVVIALATGVPLATILIIALVLACPAAMLFGMAMMGRSRTAGQDDGMAGSAGSQQIPGEVAAPSPAVTALPEATSDGADPVAILKIRLAKGQITQEEYDRLWARPRAVAPTSTGPARSATCTTRAMPGIGP